MTISIPHDFEKFLSEKIRLRGFVDPQAVVLKALSAMREADVLDASNEVELRKALLAGVDDLANGRSEAWDPQAIKANGRQVMDQRSTRQA